MVIAINKSQTGTISAGLQVTHTIQFSQAEVYQIAGGLGGSYAAVGGETTHPEDRLRFGNTEANGFLSSRGGLCCHLVEKDVRD